MFATHCGYLIAIGFGWQEALIVGAIFMLLFGSAKLPSLMRNMGRSVNEFKAGMSDKPSGVEEDSDAGKTEAIADEKEEASV